MRPFMYRDRPIHLLSGRVAMRCAALLAFLPLSQAIAQQDSKQLQIEQQMQQKIEQLKSTHQAQAKETLKQTEQLQTVDQKKELLLTLELQKKLEQLQLSSQEKMKETSKQTKQEQTLDKNKELLLELQQKREQLTSPAPEQLKEANKQSQQQTQKQTDQKTQKQTQEQRSLDKPQQLTEEVKQTTQQQIRLPQLSGAVPGSMPQNTALDTNVIAQEKYQQLLDAGIFSATSPTPANLDTTMTRAQFSAIAAKLQGLSVKSGGTFSEIDPGIWAQLAGALSADAFKGMTIKSIAVISDDKKSSADFGALLAAFAKSGFSQEELNQLIAKIGTFDSGTSKITEPASSDQLVKKANDVVADMLQSDAGTAVAATSMAGISDGTMAAISGALAAASSAAIAASSNANNIALANMVVPGTEYNVVTPRSSFPTSLNASYNGRLTGTLSNSAAVGGNLSLNVNFAAIRGGMPISGNIQFDNGKGAASFSSVAYAFGYVGGGISGSYNGEAMTGFIRDGQFFGPAANAVKGSWDMTTNSVNGGGTFAATR